MRTMWKGSISFGLVNIPIKMYAATQEKKVRFRYLHRLCQTPIQMVRHCPHCDAPVSRDDLVKGYEHGEGQYVILEQEELEAVLPEAGKTIEILDFVALNEIDPVYFQKSYYLGAQDTSSKAYALLKEALLKTDKIAIAQVTIRSRQSLAVIRVNQNCLIMETIFYPDEVRDVNQVPAIQQTTDLSEKELTMAEQLIDNLTTSFTPEKYQDQYRQSVHEIIEKKVQGAEIIEAPERRPEKVVDLMEALKASIERTDEEKRQA